MTDLHRLKADTLIACNKHNITFEECRSNSRERPISLKRKLVACELFDEGWDIDEIGIILNKGKTAMSGVFDYEEKQME